MNFEFKVNSTNGLTIKSKLPQDSYAKALFTFVSKITIYIKQPSDLLTIAQSLSNVKSWRMLNREMKKACDQYCFDNKILSHKEFQEKFFYEGTMLGRTTHGANAPWVKIETLPAPIKKSSVKTKSQEDKKIPVQRKPKGKFVPFEWNMKRDWDRKNRPAFEMLGVGIVTKPEKD